MGRSPIAAGAVALRVIDGRCVAGLLQRVFVRRTAAVGPVVRSARGGPRSELWVRVALSGPNDYEGKFLMNTRVLIVSLLTMGTPAMAGFVLGCTEEIKPPRTAAQYNDEARRAYEAAMAEYHDANWEFATQQFDEVRNNYPNTPWALKAQLRAADVLYEQGRYPDAVALYETYASEHPTDADVAYARFRAIESQVESSTNTFFQPPLEERDLANVHEAYNDIRAFEADYPDYSERRRLAYLRKSAAGMLVRHELYVARFYLRSDNFEAAQRRVQYAMRNYTGTGLDPEAVVLLGEIYLKQKQLPQAKALFRHVIDEFPESEFRVPAERFLATMSSPAKSASTANP